MDFHGMKRKQLQALCKKHGLAANLTNREMADRLASIFKESEDPVSSAELISNPEEILSEDKANAVKKQIKKVRFSPDNQTIEYEVSVYRQPRRRSRRQTLSNNPAQVLENTVSEEIKKFEGCQARVTRSRMQTAVEEEIHMASSPPAGRKRERGGKKVKDAKVVANMGDSEGLELGQKDIKNGHYKVTGGFSGRQLRSRKNVSRDDSMKIKNDKGSDEVHPLDESSEGINGRKQSTRNARKRDLGGAFNSDVEKVEVVSRVTRQSRAQSKDEISMVKNEVKIVEAMDGNETKKPLRRTKSNSEKDSDGSAASVKSDAQVTKVQEQSERDVALMEPPECLRRYSSRQKSGVSQSGKGGNKGEFPKEETRKRSRIAELEAILEDSSEVERDKYAVISQQQVPLRRSRRKTVIISASAVKLANKEDIGEMKHLIAPLLGKGTTKALDAIVEDGSEVNRAKYAATSQHQATLRRGRRKTGILTAPAVELANKEDQIAVSKSDQGVKQQVQEPILEEEETSARDHPMKQKPQRKSRHITSKGASVAPSNSTAKGVKKKRQSKSRMELVEEEAAPTENLPSPEELPDGKDVQFVVSECAGDNLDLDVSKQVVNSGDACSNKSRKEFRRNSGAKQCGFAEACPIFLNMEEDKDSAENMEETITASPVKLVGSSKDQEKKQSAHKSVVVYEKESNIVEDDVDNLVNGGNIETEVNCISSQTVNKTCVLDDVNWSDLRQLKRESKGSQGVDSSLITLPAESHGTEVSDQEMNEDINLLDEHSSHESLVVFKEDRALVESEVQVDAADSEMNHHSSTWFSNQRGAVTDSNGVKSRLVEFESNVINMDEITSRDNGHSLADQRDLTGAISAFLQSEKELETELPVGENTNFMSDDATDAISRTPSGEAQIIVELEDTNVTAAESVKEEGFDINRSSEITDLKSELQNFLKKAEEMTATDVSHSEGIPHTECSVEAAENQESGAQSHSATAKTDAQKILEIQQSSYSNTVTSGTPFGGPAPGNQFEDMCRAEAADAAGRGMFDQERSEDPNPGNEHCIHESVIVYVENTGLVKNAEEKRIHDYYFENESSPSSNRTGAVDDSNLVESRVVGSESRGSKAVCSQIASLADVFSSADHAGKTSSRMELKKVLEMQEPSGNMNSMNYNMNAEGISTPVVEDQIKGKLENANMTVADSVEEVMFNDLLNELGESIGLKRRSETPLKTSEKLSSNMFSNGEQIILTESSVKAEKQEHRTAVDVAAAISGTPNTKEMKSRSRSDTATRITSVGLVPQGQVQDKLYSAEITISLMEDEKEKQLQDDIIMGEIKNQPFLSLNKTGFIEDALVEVASNANKVVSSRTTYLADFYPSVNLTTFSGETSNELKLEEVLDLEESSRTENVVNYTSDKIEGKEVSSLVPEDHSSMHLEDTDITATEPVQKVVIQESDKMDVKGVTCPAQEDQNSMHLEDTNMTAAGSVQELLIRESGKMDVKEDTNLAPEDQSSMHIEDTNMTAAGSVQELGIWESDKMEVKEDINLAPKDHSSMYLEDTNITAAEPVQEVVVWDSDKIEVKEYSRLVEEDQTSLQLEDTNTIAAEPAQQVVYWESEKDEVKEVTILAQGYHSSIHLEDTEITAAEPAQEQVFWESDKIEVKEDISAALEDQNLMQFEDISITATEPVQEVVFRDHKNEVCESGGTEDSEVSLKKAEDRGADDSSGIGTVQTESSVETNEVSEATGEKPVTAMQSILSSHDIDLISPLRPQVDSKDVQGTTYGVETDLTNAGCAVPGQLNNEENVKIVENEDTINTEKFVSGKKITDPSSEGKYGANAIYHPLMESNDSQCAKDEKLDVSHGSFDNVSGETQEKHILDEEGNPVSPEEKEICEILPVNGCLHAINDMQEKCEAIPMDTRNDIPANTLPQHAMVQLDDESQALNQGVEIREVNPRTFSGATQALPPEELTAPINSESFSMNPFDHVLVDGDTNASGERGVDHPFINGFAATMDNNGISVSGETDVQEDNIVEKIAISPLKVELTDYTRVNVDAELYDPDMNVTDQIFQETSASEFPSTEYAEEIANAPVTMEVENNDDLDDQGEEVGLEHNCSSSFEVDGLTSTVDLTVDNISLVGTLESNLNGSHPQSGTKVDDPDIEDSDATKQLDTSFTFEEAGVEDGEKAISTIEEAGVVDGVAVIVSQPRSLHGVEEEDVSSSANTPCSKLEISIEKEHPQAMDDIDDVMGTEISTKCEVTREERDECQTNSGGFNYVIDSTLEEIVGAKSDDCEGSMKTDIELDGIDNSGVNQSPCLAERKNYNLETEEPNALHFPEIKDDDSWEVDSCSKLNIVSSMKPEMVVDCGLDERKHLENPDESNIFTNMEMKLFFGVEDEVKNSDAKARSSNDVALDMSITECNSSDIKEDIEDTYFTVRKDVPEDTEETMELSNDLSGLDAAMADKSPLLKGSEIGKGEDSENAAAFRTELNLLNATAGKERSKSVPVKQLISSIMKSKSKPGLIQRTPKLPIFHDMKENERSSKREQISNQTTPKTTSKLRLPLRRI